MLTSRITNERPRLVPLDVTVFRDDDFVVSATAFNAFTSRFTFDLRVWVRNGVHNIDSYGFGRPPSSVTTGQYLLGLEMPDGVTLTNLPRQRDQLLHVTNTDGGMRSAATTYLSDILPSSGTITLWFAWPFYGIPETRVSIDAEPLVDGGRAAEVLWPLEPCPDRPESATDNFPVTLAAGGWFEHIYRGTHPEE